ncbi:MAG: FGGY-family carbohydrate kinase, partial [Puniceicoccales bacterium]
LAATAPDLASKLPTVSPSNTCAGFVSPYFQRKYGFPADAHVIIFTGDNPSSLIGMGAGEPGTVVISLGTSDTFFAAMPAVRTDPNGYGHVFGNPAGGFMSLVCIRNGSLAREKIRSQLGVDWSAFDTEGLSRTTPGNSGNGMIPFIGPEIAPRVDFEEPLLFGSKEFRENPHPDQLVRACLEGQFINMRLQTKWIDTQTNAIRLTGGASTNDGIAQTVADVMGAPVDRLAISGSVATGAVLRAAKALGGAYDQIEAILCAPTEGSRRIPTPGAREIYAPLEDTFNNALTDWQRQAAD